MYNDRYLDVLERVHDAAVLGVDGGHAFRVAPLLGLEGAQLRLRCPDL